MGMLWEMIEAYRDRQEWPPSYRQMAVKLEMSATAFTNWRAPRDLPDPTHLHALAGLLGVPYARVLDAALVDAGYYPKVGEPGGNTAPMTPADESAKRTSRRPDSTQQAATPTPRDEPDQAGRRG